MPNINRLLEHALVIAIIIGGIGFVVSDYFDFKKEILEGFLQLQDRVQDVIYFDEVAYKFCTLHPASNTCATCQCFNTLEEHKILEKMAVRFAALSHKLRRLGKFVPPKTYKAIYDLYCWQNSVMSSERGICGSDLLKKSKKMDLWRFEITQLLEADRRTYHNSFYSIKGYLAYIFTDKMDETYPSLCKPKATKPRGIHLNPL